MRIHVSPPFNDPEDHDAARIGWFRNHILPGLQIIAALLLLLHIAQVDAQTHITTPLGSWHADSSESYHEDNKCVGVEYDGWIAGYYRNSFDEDTAYAGYVWRPLSFGEHIKAGVVGMFVTGYRHDFVVLPTVAIEWKRVAVDFVVGPTLSEKTSWFVGAQLRVRIGE
jgi:hypothetical protein